MLQLRLGRAALAGVLALFAACSDDESPVLPDPGDPPDLRASGGPPSTIASRPRFQLELQANGVLRPGVPVQLTATATGLVNTPAADIEIVLPEVASAEASSWTDYQPIEGRRIPAAASRRVSLGAGGSTVVQQTVTFPVPGYYTVVASARARDNDSIPDIVDGELLQDETHRVLYLLVDEQGGRPMTSMDPRALPATSATRMGPRIDRPGVAAPPASLARPPRPRGGESPSANMVPMRRASLAASSAATLRLAVRYQEPSTSTYRPVGGAEYYLNLYNSAFSYIGSRSGYLAADGSTTVTCEEAYYAELYTYAYNDNASVGDASNYRSGQEIAYATVYPGSDCAKGTVYVAAQAVPAHIFAGVNLTAQGAVRHFGRTRGRMPAVLTTDATVTYSTYCVDTSFLGCNNFGSEGDFLRIQTDPARNQVWGQYGLFVTAHEYGHAYHEKALGGFIRYYRGCGAHSLTTLNAGGMRCSLPEGFANYLAVVARPDETGYDYSWETNYYHNTYLSGQDGSRSEGAIAAFFYDLTDSNRWGAETFDVVQYAGSVVGDVITNCQVYQSGTWIYNNGIDHLVYCFERQVDPVVTGNAKYFPTRSPDPTSQYGGSTATSPTEVRKLWRRNLYNE
ncbi:MAG TPA: hypothetical protein VF615_16440 [Longimicrobiaceae bacterium]|jgi:hypothetical protein